MILREEADWKQVALFQIFFASADLWDHLELHTVDAFSRLDQRMAFSAVFHECETRDITHRST